MSITRLKPHPLRSVSIIVVALALLFWLVFYLFPNLDMAVARLFVDDKGRFFIADTAAGAMARRIAGAVPFVIAGLMVVAHLAQRIGRPICPAPSVRSLVYLALSLALSSGLVVNFIMKDHLHRPRPVQVTEFGGPREYRQFYQWDGTCPRNCSFPSGEASPSFWLVAPASLAPPPYRPVAMAGAIVFGMLTGLLRMSFGGHFLSDVLFAGLITIWLVAFTHWLIFRRKSLKSSAVAVDP